MPKSPRPPIDPTESPLFVQSVEKAMKVLMAFDGAKRELTLTQICELTGLDSSAGQRFTHTLAALGYLKKDPVTRRYALSVRLLDFTHHYLVSNELVHRAAPYLQQLSHKTEEACNLSVLDGSDIVFVLRIVSRNVQLTDVMVGSRLPAYCTASGLAILSTYSSEEVDEILSASRLVQHTPHTIISPRKIKARLQRARDEGFIRTEDELYIGDISTAAPVLDAGGRALGAINVAISRARWREDRDATRIANMVIESAHAITGKRTVFAG